MQPYVNSNARGNMPVNLLPLMLMRVMLVIFLQESGGFPASSVAPAPSALLLHGVVTSLQQLVVTEALCLQLYSFSL